MLAPMSERERLLTRLEEHYRDQGWAVKREDEATLAATGPGNVTWIGRAVISDDLTSGDLEGRLDELAARRMPEGNELCPLDLLPDASCEAELKSMLERAGLSERPHVSVYSLAA